MGKYSVFLHGTTGFDVKTFLSWYHILLKNLININFVKYVPYCWLIFFQQMFVTTTVIVCKATTVVKGLFGAAHWVRMYRNRILCPNQLCQVCYSSLGDLTMTCLHLIPYDHFSMKSVDHRIIRAYKTAKI